MRRMRHIPLFAYLLLIYNAVVFANTTVSNFALGTEIHAFPMFSGPVFTVSVGESLLMIGVIALYAEILKTTQNTAISIRDHLLPALTCAGYLVEFLLVAKAATAIFFTLLLMSLLVVIAGFTAHMTHAHRE
ncbi:MAG: hypothetical protein H7836_03950 [Magnetococcus sp. YQC-3]